MVEELQALLTTLAEIPNAALWAVGIFFGYKLVVFMASTGAVLMGIRYILDAVRHHIDRKTEVAVTPKTMKIGSNFINEDLEIEARGLVSLCAKGQSTYIHKSDIEWAKATLRREGKKR